MKLFWISVIITNTMATQPLKSPESLGAGRLSETGYYSIRSKMPNIFSMIIVSIAGGDCAQQVDLRNYRLYFHDVIFGYVNLGYTGRGI